MEAGDQLAVEAYQRRGGHFSFVEFPYNNIARLAEEAKEFLRLHRRDVDAVAVFDNPNSKSLRDVVEGSFDGQRILLKTTGAYTPGEGAYIFGVELPVVGGAVEFDRLVRQHFEAL